MSGNGGVEVDTQGDAFFFVFPTAPGALAAASELTERLAANGPIRVRVGLHTGTPIVADEGYVGDDVHRAARVAAAGHGGQVLVSASTAPLVEVELLDLGEHRFKDLGAPERVFQLGDGEFPPLKSLYRTNLPIPMTPFLGREQELREVVELLTGEDARLVTLTGPGRSGKTRLALQAAAEASEGFQDGVFWIPLAPLRDASALETAFAHSLEVREQPGVTATDSLVRTFAGRRALIVVDNCEHVLDAAATIIRALLERLPEACRRGVESRTPGSSGRAHLRRAADARVGRRASLRRASFGGEPGLPIRRSRHGHLRGGRRASARDRARGRAHPVPLDPHDPEHLAESLGILATRDRDVDARQRTLEATIEWSYDLLDDEERRVLRSLSVFAGGCTLAAAEAVAGADLDAIESLLDKSLIRHRIDDAGNDRYWLLETIREYAASRLSLAGEAEQADARHTEFFLQHAAELLVKAGRPTTNEQVDLYKSDAANFKVAHARALAHGDATTAIRFVRCLGRVWYRLGPFAEGYALARASLALHGGADADRANALVRAAYFAVHLGGELEAAGDLLSEAESLYTQLGDMMGLAEVLSVPRGTRGEGRRLRRGRHGGREAERAGTRARRRGPRSSCRPQAGRRALVSCNRERGSRRCGPEPRDLQIASARAAGARVEIRGNHPVRRPRGHRVCPRRLR